MPEYDNTNRGGGWAAKAVRGSVDIGGSKYYWKAIGTGVSGDRKPSHELDIKSAGPDGLKYETVLFRPDKAEHGLATGQITVAGFDYWVNIYANKSDSENSPLVDIRFKPKEQQPAAQEGMYPPQTGDDDIPF